MICLPIRPECCDGIAAHTQAGGAYEISKLYGVVASADRVCFCQRFSANSKTDRVQTGDTAAARTRLPRCLAVRRQSLLRRKQASRLASMAAQVRRATAQ